MRSVGARVVVFKELTRRRHGGKWPPSGADAGGQPEENSMVRILEFGRTQHETEISEKGVTLGELLNEFGVQTRGRRVAINGRPAGGTDRVQEGDQISVLPRVQGG